MRSKTLSVIFLSIPFALTAPAVNAADLMPVDNGPRSKQIVIDTVNPLAKVEFKNGAWLEFIDVGDGYVGIAERSPVGAPFITTTLVSEWNATPLEIYRAFAPNGPDVPALETDHNLRIAQAGGDNAEPRVLPAETFAFDDSELEEYPDCDGFGSPWEADWEDAFDGVTDYSAAAYVHIFQGSYLFYPGPHVYHGTGTNRKTYLGACNGDIIANNNLVMEVHRWAVSNVIYNRYPTPPTVVWDWVKIHEVLIEANYKSTFYSGHPTGRYRGRVQAIDLAYMGFAAAWTKSFPVVGLSSD